MKIISFTGFSGSGKTALIRSLIPLLSRYGPVGTVKHTGHHSIELPEGKDTTIMFEAGARAVAGIDREKTLVTLKSTSLTDALDILAGQGIAVALVEGYKKSALPKIVIGDLEAEGCVLRNPDPEDVIHALDRFPDYICPREILEDLRAACNRRKKPYTAASTVPLSPVKRGDSLPSLERVLPEIVRIMEDLNGIIGARAAISRGSLFGKSDELLIAVAAGKADEAASVLRITLSRSRENWKEMDAAYR